RPGSWSNLRRGEARWNHRPMVYDDGLMRSILALAMALVVLAAEAPGLFVESPVCAAIDGVNAVARGKRRPTSPSCCGTASCPMHARGCGKHAACSMEAAYGPDPIIASSGSSSETKLCAPSCGREGARLIPGMPAPGTMDPPGAPATLFAAANRLPAAPCGHHAGNP